MIITDRSGHVLYEHDGRKPAVKVEQEYIDKYGKSAIFIFRAEPSRETAIGPGRITSPRRFSLHD